MTINKNKLEKLHSLANFGKISAGIVHDLINPLNALILNLEQIIIINKNKKMMDYLNQSHVATLNIKNILINAKKQINFENKKTYFNVRNEINKIIIILNYQIKQEKINIFLKVDQNIIIHGSKVKFNRIITNLLINAIEACKKTKNERKKIYIKIIKHKNEVIIKIIDNGCGIPNSIKNKLFQAFVSKKNSLGLGLYLVKKIIEEDFKGTIENLNNNKKTIFQIKLNC
jgi:C4-dicarboxylate-specific signal transduction histidine kinase